MSRARELAMETYRRCTQVDDFTFEKNKAETIIKEALEAQHQQSYSAGLEACKAELKKQSDSAHENQNGTETTETIAICWKGAYEVICALPVLPLGEE